MDDNERDFHPSALILPSQWLEAADHLYRLQLRGQWRLCTAFPVSPLNVVVSDKLQFVDFLLGKIRVVKWAN